MVLPSTWEWADAVNWNHLAVIFPYLSRLPKIGEPNSGEPISDVFPYSFTVGIYRSSIALGDVRSGREDQEEQEGGGSGGAAGLAVSGDRGVEGASSPVGGGGGGEPARSCTRVARHPRGWQEGVDVLVVAAAAAL